MANKNYNNVKLDKNDIDGEIALCKERIDFDNHIPYNIVRTANYIREAVLPKYMKVIKETAPLSVREHRVLGLLGEYSPLSPARAAELTGMNRGTITRAIISLEKYGLVKTYKNARDGRGKYIVPTEKGATLCDQIIPKLREHNDFLGANLSDEEKELLFKLLSKIAEQAKMLSNLDE